MSTIPGPQAIPGPQSDPGHPVLDLIRRRRDARSQPGARADGYRLGVAVEGGGMRGVVSAAMLVALTDCGVRPCFDLVIGTSAGAISGAYFLTDTGWEALGVYFQELLTPEFISLRRLVGRRPVLSLEFLLESVLKGTRPLDWQAVLDSPIPLHVTVGSLDTLQPILLSGLDSPAQLQTALRAAACLPLLAEGPIPWHGDRLVDAGTLDGHPVRHAKELGCTHVLALSTRATGGRSRTPMPLERQVARRLERLQAGLGAAYLSKLAGYGEDKDLLAEASRSGAGDPLMFEIAPPPGVDLPSRLEREPDILLAAGIAGYEAAASAITGRPIRASLRLVPHPSTPLWDT